LALLDGADVILSGEEHSDLFGEGEVHVEFPVHNHDLEGVEMLCGVYLDQAVRVGIHDVDRNGYARR
jgi:hypothetical protein